MIAQGDGWNKREQRVEDKGFIIFFGYLKKAKESRGKGLGFGLIVWKYIKGRRAINAGGGQKKRKVVTIKKRRRGMGGLPFVFKKEKNYLK